MKSNEYGAYMVTQFIAAVLAGLTVNVVGGHGRTRRRPHGQDAVAEFLFTFALA